MHDTPREQLQRIVVDYGREVLHDPRRCRALLMDLCGEYRAEINLIEMALRENVVEEFEKTSGRVPRALEVARLARRLRDAYYLPPEAAHWAVEACVQALDGRPPDAGLRILQTDVAARVLGRDWSEAGGDWVELGVTPGKVEVPAQLEVRIAAQVRGRAVQRLTTSIERFGPIQHLDLSYSELSDTAATHLAKVRGLLSLDLSRTPISDSALRVLKAFPQLQSLTLRGCEAVTDEALAHIARLRHLEDLELGLCSRITGVGFRGFRNLDRFAELGLSGTLVDDQALSYIKLLDNLRQLDLSGTPITGSGLVEVSELQDLATLGLRGCVRLRPESLLGLRRLPQLATLDLSACGLLTDEALVYVRSLRGLTRLVLEGLPITDVGVLYLADLVALATLDLSWTQVGDPGLGRIARLRGLRELRLSGTPITDAGLAALAALPDLRVLDLSNTHITNAGLRDLVAVPSLEVLDLESTGIHDAGLVHLGELPQLRRVYLGSTAVTDAGLDLLQRICDLESVDLTLCPGVSRNAIEGLKENGISVSC